MSNSHTMSEISKILLLGTGLSPGLKEEIIYQDGSEGMVEFVKLLKKAKTKMKAYQAEHSGQRPRHAQRAPSAPAAVAPPLQRRSCPQLGQQQQSHPHGPIRRPS